MESLRGYLHTDWSAMTLHDWMGMAITVVVFLGMVAGYVMVFNPKNKERFEARRTAPLDHDEQFVEGNER